MASKGRRLYINHKICGIRKDKSTWLSVENVEVEAAGEQHGDEGSDPVHGKHGKHTQKGPNLTGGTKM